MKTKNIFREMNRLLSIFDYTGNWSRPYEINGWQVTRIDIQDGFDLFHWNYKVLPPGHFKGILIAEPCTDYAISGAKHFSKKDANGNTYESMALTYKSLAIVQYFQPEFWTLENPMSRIHKLVPELGKIYFKFHPYEFAGYDSPERNSQYKKETWLWGKFNQPIKMPREPIDGQKLFKNLGGKSLKTKNERSKTPMGFSYAFYEVNK